MKNSKKARIMSYVFGVVSVLSLVGGIVMIILQGAAHIDWITTGMWFISSALWGTCGIMIFKSAKVLKEKEDSKPKVNAFNYGKRKLHKKVK